jgi:D-glycero-D-manno-heptose 1,7-bisphosphate phosphatase
MTNPREHSPAVFLDKDGTLINDVPYNVDPSLIELAPRAAEGAALLSAAGFALVVVSNQSGVARGLFPEAAIAAVDARIRELLTECEVSLAGFYYCPHHPQGTVERYSTGCDCRKPAPGMLTRAAEEMGLDLARSWMIGDILDDVEAGHRAGCRSILIDNGHETLWQWNPRRQPDFIAPDLAAAARTILAADARAVQRTLETVP